MWTEQEAKAKLSEVMQAGASSAKRRSIGEQEPCVVISLDEYKRLKARAEEPHPGRWLVEHLRGPRRDRTAAARRSPSIPFADWTDEDLRS